MENSFKYVFLKNLICCTGIPLNMSSRYYNFFILFRNESTFVVQKRKAISSNGLFWSLSFIRICCLWDSNVVWSVLRKISKSPSNKNSQFALIVLEKLTFFVLIVLSYKIHSIFVLLKNQACSANDPFRNFV